jgi:membrane protease YdiL (CAAX protease family)
MSPTSPIRTLHGGQPAASAQSSVTNSSLNRKRIAVTALAMTLPLLLCFVYFVWLPGTAIATIAYTGIKVWLLLWPIIVGLWILRSPREAARSRIGLNRLLPPPPASEAHPPARRSVSIVQGIVFGLAVSAVAWLLLKIPVIGAELMASGDQIRASVRAFGIMEHYWLFAVFLALAHSALEEFYWRGFVFGNLRHLMKPWLAHTLAAIGFAAHHVVVLDQFFPTGLAWIFGTAVALGGLTWSWLYARHGTLLGAWISHLIVDVAILVVGWHLMTA